MSDLTLRLRAAAFNVRRQKMPLGDLIPMMQEAADRIEADEALMRTAAHLLKRYVSETPLGNQPHMIAMEADAAITALRARLENGK